MSDRVHFDEYADNYDAALDHGISLSGEDKNYFARRRLEWLQYCLQGLTECPQRVMDYGCGSGSATPLLLEILCASFVLGVDTSPKLLASAKSQYTSDRVEFESLNEYQPSGRLDLVYCNGVFRHIPPQERASSVRCIWNSLHPGGFLALWENNPLNPGTRLVMSRIPFDRDAVTLTARKARRLLRGGGFEVLRTDFHFIFPRALKLLRGIEPRLSSFPFGAQYQVLCRKPAPCGPSCVTA